MSVYAITRRCGHVDQVDITGTNSRGEREARAAREAQRLCGPCWQGERAAAAARSRAERETAGGESWPVLHGSARLVEVAGQVREELLTGLAGQVEALYGKGGRPDLVEPMTALYEQVARSQHDAQWWMDGRRQELAYLVQTVMRADPYWFARHQEIAATPAPGTTTRGIDPGPGTSVQHPPPAPGYPSRDEVMGWCRQTSDLPCTLPGQAGAGLVWATPWQPGANRWPTGFVAIGVPVRLPNHRARRLDLGHQNPAGQWIDTIHVDFDRLYGQIVRSWDTGDPAAADSARHQVRAALLAAITTAVGSFDRIDHPDLRAATVLLAADQPQAGAGGQR